VPARRRGMLADVPPLSSITGVRPPTTRRPLYCTAKAKDFGPKAELDVWRRHRECWEHVVDLSPVPGAEGGNRHCEPLAVGLRDARGL
jgi:hypothetical protein